MHLAGTASGSGTHPSVLRNPPVADGRPSYAFVFGKPGASSERENELPPPADGARPTVASRTEPWGSNIAREPDPGIGPAVPAVVTRSGATYV